MMAWHRITSRRPSRPEVGGGRPVTMLSWKATSSFLNPLSYPATSSVRQERLVLPAPPSISSTAGSLRRNGDGKVSRSRRSGAYSANSIPYRAIPGRSIQWMAAGRSPNRSITVTWFRARLA